MESDSYLLNEGLAQNVVNSIENSEVRNLVLVGIAHARMQFLRSVGDDEELHRSKMPSHAFDMAFFARVLTKLFTERDVIEALYQGKSIEEAAGWVNS